MTVVPSTPNRVTDPLKPFLQEMLDFRPADTQRTSGQHRRLVDLLETSTTEVQSLPLPVQGFLDGIQMACLAGRGGNHRDVTVAYVSGGTVRGMTLEHVEERLAIICSAADAELVSARNVHGLEVIQFPETEPWDIATQTDDWIDAARREVELRAINNTTVEAGHFLAVDGPLPPSVARINAFGLVKRVLDTDWTPVRAHIPVSEGWRSPAFVIRATRVDEHDRLSCYLRLRDVSERDHWSFSLVRVEVSANAGIDILEGACAVAMAERQGPHSGDPRWEVQARSMATTEKVLRARAPIALEVFR